MNSKNELLDNYSFPEEYQLIPKTEPIDTYLIKKEGEEEEEGEFFVVPGLVEPLKVDKVSVKKELCENEEIENCSSTNV